MNSVRLAHESRGSKPPINRRFIGVQLVAGFRRERQPNGLNPPLKGSSQISHLNCRRFTILYPASYI